MTQIKDQVSEEFRIWKFMIRGDEPVLIHGKEFRGVLAVVIARNVAEARTLAKVGFAAGAGYSEPFWIDYTEPTSFPINEPSFIALSDA